jgi:hypothetical protein
MNQVCQIRPVTDRDTSRSLNERCTCNVYGCDKPAVARQEIGGGNMVRVSDFCWHHFRLLAAQALELLAGLERP